jgi:hypothetical protein
VALNTFDQAAYKAMRRLPQSRRYDPFVAFYALAGVIRSHVAAVIVTEMPDIAMFTGRKILLGPPQDSEFRNASNSS